MNSTIFTSLSSLASLSEDAAKLAQSLTTAMAEAEIEQLRTQINELQQEVSRLTVLLNSDEDPEWNDAHIQSAYQEFKLLQTQNSDQLALLQLPTIYTYEGLKTLPRSLRFLICTDLVDMFEARKMVVPKLWTLLVARQGVF